MGRPCSFYAQQNNESLPVAPAAPDNNWAEKMGGWRANAGTDKGPTITDVNVPVDMSLWMLIQQGSLVAKIFICPSSNEQKDDLRDSSGQARPATELWGFKPGSLSYSYAMPYNSKNRARPSTNMDSRMALTSDASPYYDNQGKRTTVTVPTLVSLDIPLEQWKTLNSRNHNREGQNVLYVDTHVEFIKRSSAGIGDDNIYTSQGATSSSTPWAGTVPTGTDVPQVANDSVLVH